MNPQDSGVNNSNLPPTQPFQPPQQDAGPPQPVQQEQPPPPAPQPAQSSSTPPQPPPQQPGRRVGDELEVMQEGEQKIFDLKRHPIGIILVYVGITLTLALAGALLFVLVPSVDPGNDQLGRLSLGIFATLTAFSLIYAIISTAIYWGNRWILTSDSLTQIVRSGLFSRQSAQLALVNIEDVTAEQHGILAHIFGYGTLNAQTAAEHGKFVFVYTPHPNYYAQQVLKAKEELARKGHSAH